MAWSIEIGPIAEKSMSKLDPHVSRRIFKFLRERVATLKDPRTKGAALQGSALNTYWKYRLGDYRIVCDIIDSRLVIIAIDVGHRREIYR